jgi:hypothetical protein
LTRLSSPATAIRTPHGHRRIDTINLVPDVETPDQLRRFGDEVISPVRAEMQS